MSILQSLCCTTTRSVDAPLCVFFVFLFYYYFSGSQAAVPVSQNHVNKLDWNETKHILALKLHFDIRMVSCIINRRGVQTVDFARALGSAQRRNARMENRLGSTRIVPKIADALSYRKRAPSKLVLSPWRQQQPRWFRLNGSHRLNLGISVVVFLVAWSHGAMNA